MQSCEQLNDIFDYLRAQRAGKKWAYIEVRCPSSAPAQHFRNFAGQQVFAIHKLALDGREQVWQRLHQNCVRRKVQRAAREQVSCVEGRSDSLLRQFYELLVMTRARHGVPPQPISWFQNLIECLGSKIKISVAFKGDRPIAGILILQYKQVVTYKYGCSDPRFSSLGGIQHLLWKTIQDGIADGMVEFDMGRSDPGQGGLIAFKRRWGAAESQLMYLRFPARPPHSRSSARIARIGKYVCSHVPSRILTVAGNALYRHAG
jgi:lipid II:glycine glycyltransferase (peptidoglycan interpeptide bridge formation enzyme)